MSWLGGVLKDPEKRAMLSWLGGGAVVVAGGLWAVFTFYVDHKDGQDKKGGTSPELVAQIQKPLADELAAQRAQIAALTKMLLEKSPVAAAPGTQQAVGAAVQSIAQGASEGHPRLQEALDLLKDNKVAEATKLLNAVAEDKTTQAETDRKEAAIAYRNLGAIAGLRDPKAAREAYAKAVALDPDNAEGLFWDGWFQLKATNLAAAEKSYRALLRLADKGANEDQIFWARAGLGDIAVARGDLNAALATYDEARAAMERLAGSDATNADWQRDLSVSNNKIGDVLVSQGNLPEAGKSYRAGLAIAERLAGSDSWNSDWQRDLSVSNNKIGDVLVKQGNLPEALKSYRTGLAIRERLAGSDAGNVEWQRDLSVSNNKIGDVLVKQGNLPEALKSYRAGLVIAERLAGSDAGNAVWQRDLSVSNNKIGDVLVKQGDLPEALKSYRAGLVIAERLAGSDTGNAEWQRDLIISYKKIADCAPKERPANLTHALDIARALDASDRLAPADKWMLNDLARLIAELPEKQGRARSGH
jgi:tetratricopeptide (TPR) repeat protein